MYTLITAATSAQAHQLKNKIGGDNILLGDYLDLPEMMLSSGKMIKLPNPASTSYAHQMLTLCLDKQINTVYALGDEEQKLLKEAGQLFGEFGIEIV
jgi:hypothetical protein